MSNITMRTIELADSGSHYYRADFQVHTPRDNQWKGARPSTEIERQEWAREFVAAARAKDLHAVAISDHHDFTYFPYIKAAAGDERGNNGEILPEKERLVVFPALELSLLVPCQAIMILDADFPIDRLDDVLKALHFEPIDPTLESLPSTENLEHSGDLNEIHAKLDKNRWLYDRYIILPNVSPKGHRTLMRDQFQGKYKDMIPVGGYIDGSLSRFDKETGTKRILDGLVPAWGSKRLALFQTSDARSADLAELGQHSTWIKWSAPTAEALRQACLAQESRLAQSSPSLPNVWISRLVVSQSKFMGHVDILINPQFTALIGGRGTGKSTMLDYLRWVLCDQPANSSEDDEVVDPRVRQRRLIEATLMPLDAHVEVHCVINGITHIVRRFASDGSVQLKVAEGEFERVHESAIQSLLPIQAYSQKQLSSVAIRVDELLRFVTSPIKRELEDIARKRQEVAERLRENYGTLQRHRTLTTEIKKTEIHIRSLDGQAQALRNSLSGVSEADREVLNDKASYDRARSTRESLHQDLTAADEDLSTLITSVGNILERVAEPDDIPAAISTELSSLRSEIVNTLGTLQIILAEAKHKLESAAADEQGAIVKASALLLEKLQSYDETYLAVKSRSSTQDAKLAELGRLEAQQNAASELLQKQRKEWESLADPLVKHKELRQELAQARRERSDALAVQCLALSESSDGAIKASLSSGTGFGAAQAKFKALITGSNVRTNKVEALFEELAMDSNPADTWEKALDELESLMLLEVDEETSTEQTPTLSRLGLGIGDQKKVAPKLSPDGWLDLSLVDLAEYPEFEYKSKENEYIPFSSASAGQQASALLATLLSQGGTPLIIDQPEDDLDSETVQRIVTKIWPSKSRRQLIFSSHNANLVVNGDADLVLVCAYVTDGDQSSGHIKQQGAIDIASVKDEITSVMEGGEKAFRLRKEKYGF